jgi:hypothetical protein
VILKEGHPGSSGVDSHFDPDAIVPVSRVVPFRQIDASCIFPLRFYHSLSASMSDEPGLAQCTSCCSRAQSHKHGIRGSRSFRYPDPFVGGAKWLGVRLPVVSVNSREVQWLRSRANVRRPYSDTTAGVLNFSLVSYALVWPPSSQKPGGAGLNVSFQIIGETPPHFLADSSVAGFLLPAVRAVPETAAPLKIFAAHAADICNDFLHQYVEQQSSMKGSPFDQI